MWNRRRIPGTRSVRFKRTTLCRCRRRQVKVRAPNSFSLVIFHAFHVQFSSFLLCGSFFLSLSKARNAVVKISIKTVVFNEAFKTSLIRASPETIWSIKNSKIVLRLVRALDTVEVWLKLLVSNFNFQLQFPQRFFQVQLILNVNQ